MSAALVGLGGNLGDVRATLSRAVAAFCDGTRVRLLARSGDYQTPPWGRTDQPAFVNLALKVETDLPPEALLDQALKVEASLGRDRSKAERWGPRPIDIDILAYDGLEIETERLTLPHPRLTERAFVLVPLDEIAPDWLIAGHPVSHWAAHIDKAGVTRLFP